MTPHSHAYPRAAAFWARFSGTLVGACESAIFLSVYHNTITLIFQHHYSTIRRGVTVEGLTVGQLAEAPLAKGPRASAQLRTEHSCHIGEDCCG